MSVTILRKQVRHHLEEHLDRAASAYLNDRALKQVDFSAPAGEPSFASPDSVSWRIFKNPVSLYIGGAAAVLLELAEPRVRTGVWEHSSFRTDPVTRMKRTGLAAMITVYGAASVAEDMIAIVNRMHARVEGVTDDGAPYAASDPALLDWVQATAGFGFLEAYSAYVAPLTDEDRNNFYSEGGRAARLYGAVGAPRSLAAQQSLFGEMTKELEASEAIFEFIDIMRRAPALPQPGQFMQRVFLRAAVDLLPADIRRLLGLGPRFGLRPFEKTIVRRMGRRADRLMLKSSPPSQACLRVGLPADYLYRRR